MRRDKQRWLAADCGETDLDLRLREVTEKVIRESAEDVVRRFKHRPEPQIAAA